jgi:hypothetical protein
MTWGRALPKLVVAGIFDLLGLLCDMLWFFGPALAGVACTAGASNYLPTSFAALVCGAGATFLGVAGAAALIPAGTVLAMAVGLFGWLTLFLWLSISNKSIFKANGLWFASSLLFEEIPLINALPLLTGILIKMYATQIRTEKAAYKKYEGERAAQEAAERQQMEAQFAARAIQEGAANEAAYAAESEAIEQNQIDDEEYGQDVSKAA